MQSEQIDLSSIDAVRRRYIAIRHPKLICILRVQDSILSSIREFLHKKGFIEILAPIIGPVTDPGIRGAKQVSFDYYGLEFKVMSSMVLYKQMAISSLEKVFAISPNVRLEPLQTLKTGRHLCEFRQVDIEQAFIDYRDAMRLAEELLQYVCRKVKHECGDDLKVLERKLKVPSIPFKRLTYEKALRLAKSLGFEVKFGEEIPWSIEREISFSQKGPFFITDYPKEAREFYYIEHEEKPGFLKDFDLLYPEGYGEAVSGGEREYRYEKVIERMKETGEDPRKYGWYLDMLKYGIPKSAGFGIGLERLTRYVCGLEKIWEAVPFPKLPGIFSP